MKVSCELEAGLTDDFEVRIPVKIGSHWHDSDKFEVLIDGKSYWFRRQEFLKAVANACNH